MRFTLFKGTERLGFFSYFSWPLLLFLVGQSPLTVATNESLPTAPKVIISIQQFNQLTETLSEKDHLLIQGKLDRSNLVTKIESLLNGNHSHHLKSRYVIYQAIVQLSQTEANSDSRKLLSKLTQLQQAYFTYHYDAGHKILLPAFPIANTAKNLLHKWDNQVLQQKAKLALEQGDSYSFADTLEQMTQPESFLIDLLKSRHYSTDQLSTVFQRLDAKKFPVAFTWLMLRKEQLDNAIYYLTYIRQADHRARALIQFSGSLATKNKPVFFQHLLKHSPIFSLASAATIKHFPPDRAFEFLVPYLANRNLGGEASFQLSQILNETMTDQLATRYAKPNKLVRKRILSTLNHSKNSRAIFIAKQLKEATYVRGVRHE